MSNAQTNYQRIHTFGPSPALGSSPRGNLVQGSNGSLYGITYAGGSNQWGTIFRINPDGTGFKPLHHFANPMLLPVAGLIEASNGWLYGAVPTGGDHNGGVVFKIQKDGTGFTVIHHLNAALQQGESPMGALIQGHDGFLYGTAAGDGGNSSGAVFKLGLEGGDYTVLHQFSGSNGKTPSAALLQGVDGMLYGTTRKGGTADAGTVFKLGTNGTGFAVLRQFLGKAQNDGQEPMARVIQGADGFLYGTTYLGGTADAGTIFKISTNGTGYAIIYHCQHTLNNGAQPVSGVIQAPDGFLYGTTPGGGINHNGVAFRLSTNGTFTVLRHFTGSGGDGAKPYAPLLLAADGAFYGSTFNGGDHIAQGANGILFRLQSAVPAGKLVISNLVAGTVPLRFEQGAFGRSYTVQRGSLSAPGSWENVDTRSARIDGSFELTDNNPNPAKSFYRTLAE